jgi:hypothetical protein
MMLVREVVQVAERSKAELGDEQGAFIDGCPRDWADLPHPDGPLTVAGFLPTFIGRPSLSEFLTLLLTSKILQLRKEPHPQSP